MVRMRPGAAPMSRLLLAPAPAPRPSSGRFSKPHSGVQPPDAPPARSSRTGGAACSPRRRFPRTVGLWPSDDHKSGRFARAQPLPLLPTQSPLTCAGDEGGCRRLQIAQAPVQQAMGGRSSRGSANRLRRCRRESRAPGRSSVSKRARARRVPARPTRGQVDPPVERTQRLIGRRRDRHDDLAVKRAPQRPRVLRRATPIDQRPLFRKVGVVDDPRLRLKLGGHAPRQIHAHHSLIPRRLVDALLQALPPPRQRLQLTEQYQSQSTKLSRGARKLRSGARSPRSRPGRTVSAAPAATPRAQRGPTRRPSRDRPA